MQHFFSKAFSYYSTNITKIIYYTCAFTLGIVFIERLFIIFSYEGHTAGIDNNFDYPIIRSLAGFSIYPNPEGYPYAVNPYAPLFFIVCKWVALLLHVNPTDTISVYWVSRSVCLVADIGTCLIFFRLLRKYAKANNAIAIICTTLFFSIISFLGYTINRSDAFFLLFYCSTIYVLLKFSDSKSILASLLPAILTTLCIFSKQNGIALLMLVPVWFIVGKNYRLLLLFILFSFIFLTGMFLYFEYIYTNNFFSRHIIDALKNKIDPRWFYVYVFKLIAPSYFTLPLAASLIIAIKSIAENNQSLLKKLSILCLLQFMLSTALSFKWGSSLGYYNESFLLAFIVIPFFYNIIPSPIKKAGILTTGIYTYPAFLILLIHMTGQLFFFFLNNNSESKENYDEQVQIANYIKRSINTQDKYVLDLSNADFNFFKNLLFKESAAPNIDAVNCCTLPANIFDYSGLLNGLQNGRIMFIIKGNGDMQNNTWGVDIQHYKQDTTFTHYSIYKYDSIAVKEH